MEISTDAIILKIQPYKEKDRIVFAYSKDFGKISFIAKGVNQLKSKNAPSLQELTHVELVIIPKKGMATLIKSSIVNFHRNIKEDLSLQIYASYMCEYVYKQEESNQPRLDIYSMLIQSLDALESGYPAKLIYALFNLKYLSLTGYDFEVDSCVNCDNTSQIVSISIQAGGFVCNQCLTTMDKVYSKDQLKLFRHMKLLGLNRIDEIKYKKEDLEIICDLCEKIVDEYSGIYFNTKKFLSRGIL